MKKIFIISIFPVLLNPIFSNRDVISEREVELEEWMLKDFEVEKEPILEDWMLQIWV
jgi:hypothetical protein